MFVFGEEAGCVPFSTLLADDGSQCPLDVSFDPHQQVALLPYSSGTTGMPKGVMLSHFAEIANSIQSEYVSSYFVSAIICSPNGMRVRDSDRVRSRDILHLWLRRTLDVAAPGYGGLETDHIWTTGSAYFWTSSQPFTF